MIDYSNAYISRETLDIYQPDELQDAFIQWSRGVASREGNELKLELSDYIELEKLIPCNQFQMVHETGRIWNWNEIIEMFDNDDARDEEELSEYIANCTCKNSEGYIIDSSTQLDSCRYRIIAHQFDCDPVELISDNFQGD